MQRDYKLYLNDIIEAIHRIESYMTDLNKDEFSENSLYQDAVVRNLEIIGEAVKNIPKNFRKKNPDVEWKKIAGIRDILAHSYFGIDIDIVWDIMQNKIPELKDQINLLLSKINKRH